MTNPADSFFGGGVPGLSWYRNVNGTYIQITELIGVIRGGVILRDPVVHNRTEMGSGKPMLWPDGTSKQQMMVALLCDGSRGGARDERDPTNPADRGNRQLAIKSFMIPAVREALQAVDVTGLRMGGELYVALLGKQLNGNGDRWAAKYVPPTVGIPEGGAQSQPQNGLSGAPEANPFGQADPAARVAAPPLVGAQDPATSWQSQQTVPAGPPPNPFG